MPNVQLAGGGFGGQIQGNFGIYQANTDGSFTVDSRDVPSLLTLGMAYVKQSNRDITLPMAPAAAAVGGVVSSGALSNGTVAVTTQPTVMRPVNVEIGTGTTPITAGNVSVTYLGNDGVVTTDNVSAVIALSTSETVGLSKGVQSISNITVSGLVGGTAPWIRLSTTAQISLPVDPGAIDFAVNREYDAGATVAVGTLGTALASIAPTTAPNGTVTYSFSYSFTSPVS
jgi:hypothetical protein